MWVENKTVRKRKVFFRIRENLVRCEVHFLPLSDREKEGWREERIYCRDFCHSGHGKREERGKRKVAEEKEKLDPGYLFSGEKEEGGYDKYSEQILAVSPDCMGEDKEIHAFLVDIPTPFFA